MTEPDSYVHYMRRFEDGCALVLRMTFGKGRLAVQGHPESAYYDDGWCYDSVEAAIAAAEAWDGEGEPAGWFRHPFSGRRRVDGDGDPARETVRW